MGDFHWGPLVKQVDPTGGTMRPSAIPPIAGEVGQPAGEVGPVAIVIEVAPSAPSSI